MFAVSVLSNVYRVVSKDAFAGVVCFERLKLSDAFGAYMLLTRMCAVCYWAVIFQSELAKEATEVCIDVYM